MIKKYKRTISWILSVVMVLSLTITNFNINYADEMLNGIATGSDIEEVSDEYFSKEIDEIEDGDMQDELEEFEEEPEEDVDEVIAEENDDMFYDENDEEEIDEASPSDIEEDNDIEDDEINEASPSDIEEENDMEDDEIDEASPSDVEVDDEINEASPSDVEIETEDDIVATQSDAEEDIEEINEASPSEATPSEILFMQNAIDEITTPSDISEGGALGFIPIEFDVPKVKKKLFLDFFGDSPLPASYDARDEENPANTSMSVVPPVRNQNPFGTCWAHSTIGMMETSIRKKGLVDNEVDADLSESALAYNYYHMKRLYDNMEDMDEPGLEGKDYTEIVNESPNIYNGNNNWAQMGGNQLNVTLVMASYMGAVKEEENVTDAESIKNNNGLDTEYIYKKNKYVINNVQYINKTDMNEIKKAIMANGSVGISYYESAGEAIEYFNREGVNAAGEVIIDKNGNNITGNPLAVNTIDHYEYYGLSNRSADDGNHAVMVVGWDDNIPKEKFANHGVTASRDGAWLVRNSWGESSRTGGYFWMSYDEPSLYKTVFSIDAIKADTYQYNYHYDTTGITYTSGRAVYYGAGNVFKVPEDAEEQILDAASITLDSSSATFDISIYTKDTQMNDPEDGEEKLTQTKSIVTAGIYTVPLDTKVILSPGTYFSIVVKPHTQGQTISILFDRTVDAGSVVFNNMVNKGESYLKNGNYWQDQNPSANNSYPNGFSFRIKALTNLSSGVGFDANGGSGTMSRLNGPEDTDVTVPACTFERTGYTFNKWNTKADGSGTDYYENNNITLTDEAITLYAQWTPIHYYLAFDNNGQSGTAVPVSYAYDEEVNLGNPGFSSNQYTLDGWQIASGSAARKYELGETGVTGLASTEGATYTLYAHWIPGAYYIAFNGNGATGMTGGTSGSTMSNQTITIGQSTALTPNAYYRTGYEFAGWNTEADGIGTPYADKEVFNKSNAQKEQTYTLYAQWIPIIYYIKYYANGGSVSPSQITKTYGTSVTLATPSKTGYTFAAWYKESELTNVYDGTSDLTSAKGTTKNIYAKWQPITYTVKFDLNGKVATAPSDKTKTYGVSITDYNNIKPTNLPDGYEFKGWYKEAGCTSVYNGISDLSSTQGDEVTVYAKWEAITYSIKYNANGKTATMPSNTTKKYDIAISNFNNIKPTNIQVGYKFAGWYKEAGCTNEYDGTSDLTTTSGDIVNVYAKWEQIKYTLKLDPNSSGQSGNVTGDVVTLSNKNYEEEIVLGNQGFTSTTHSFGGWSLTSGANNTKKYDEGATVKKLTATDGAEVTLYVKWVPGAYKVIFNGNDATSGSMGNQSITVGQGANLTQNAYKKTGYKFAGWATASDAAVAYTDKALFKKLDAVKDQTYTLYAKWTPITYNIKYYANGGSISPTQITKTYDTDITLATPSKTGYTFVAWYKESGLTNVYNGTTDLADTQGVTKNIYAKWELSDNYAEVQFNSHGGSQVSSEAVEKNVGKFTKPSNPTRSGYSFVNWYKESTYNTVYDFNQIATESITLHAKWNQNSSSGGNTGGGSHGGSSGGGGSGGGGGGGGGSGMTLNQMGAFPLSNDNLATQENAKLIKSRGQDQILLSKDVTWNYDAMSGSWSLSTNENVKAINGFYIVASLDISGNIVSDVYNFDENGKMVTGWAKDSLGNMYFFENMKNTNEGKLTFGWKEIGQGIWYCFNQDGILMTNTVTPDGYPVGADGKWIK